LILACLLHPNYRLKPFNTQLININYVIFGQWLGYYYRAWSGKEPKCILKEFDDFCLEIYPFDSTTWDQFDDDIFRFWCFVCTSTNELDFVACKLFGICVNAASVERLWSCMSFLHSNRRNRLMASIFNLYCIYFYIYNLY